MVRRFCGHMSLEVRPSIGTDNAQELIFDKIDSGYAVTVATEEGAGRSDTAQMQHASEASRWVIKARGEAVGSDCANPDKSK
jgi:hypothetical protein